MATRHTRARPLDQNKQVEIVRDLSILDAAEGFAGPDLLAKLEADERETKQASPLRPGLWF